jgi:hypothetical protein
LGRYFGAERGSAIQTAQGQQVAAIVGDGNGHGPAVVVGFLLCGVQYLNDVGLAQNGFGLHQSILLIMGGEARRLTGKA